MFKLSMAALNIRGLQASHCYLGLNQVALENINL